MDHSQDTDAGMDHTGASHDAAPAGDPTAVPARVTDIHGTAIEGTADPGLELVQRLQARDPGALEALYRAHRARAFGLALRVLGDRAAAEDAVHAAFLALWERAEHIEPDRGRIESLLMTIVHRRAVDLARRRGRAPRFEQPGPGPGAGEQMNQIEQIPDEQAYALFEHLLEDGALEQSLRKALDALPAEQREVIVLAYFDGLTHRAIAERLGLPPGTVKSRVRLGMERLRNALGVDAASRRNGDRP